MQELNLPAAYSLLSRIHANQKNNGKGISLTLIVCQKRFCNCFSGQNYSLSAYTDFLPIYAEVWKIFCASSRTIWMQCMGGFLGPLIQYK